jgi:hypothetical protein
MSKTEFSGCGILCSDCEYYTGEKKPKCLGCNIVEGKPFWGSCDMYNCILEHNVEQCGRCKEFPCDIFIESFDPSQGPKSALIRAGVAAYRSKHGNNKAASLVRKISKL